MKWTKFGWALVLCGGLVTTTWAERSPHGSRGHAQPVVQRSCAPGYYPARPSTYGRGYTPPRMAHHRPVYAPRVMAQPGYWVWQDMGCGNFRRVWQPACVVPVLRHGSYVVITRW